jgi:hypothetical protein
MIDAKQLRRDLALIFNIHDYENAKLNDLFEFNIQHRRRETSHVMSVTALAYLTKVLDIEIQKQEENICQ